MKKGIWAAALWMAAMIGLSGCGAKANNAEENFASPQIEELEEEKETDISEILPEAEIRQMILEKESESPKGWREAYQTFIDDWKQIEKYGDFSYLEMYFGKEHYNFDKYFLCDVDGNGTPELFLYSTYMGLTAVFTYTDVPVFLLYNDICGINFETDEVVIHGHWHGAGGSWENEWSAYCISEDTAEYTMYIDFMDLSEYDEGIRYTVYDAETEEYIDSQDGTEYDAFYTAHVKPCILAEDYLLYDFYDESGFDHIQ